MGNLSRYHSTPLLRLQRRTVLPDLHPCRHHPNLRLRSHRHQNSQKSISLRTLQINLHMLHRHLRHPRTSLPVLQGKSRLTQGYLPNDTTGNFIFRVQEAVAVLLSGYILYCIMIKFKTSYNQDLDTVKSYYLILVAAVLALLFHSSLNRSFVGDYFWAFSQYLETFAILSQFVLFRNKVL